MFRLNFYGWVGIIVLFSGVVACGKQEAAKPPEKITNVTVAPMRQIDIPITEVAVGAETAIGSALGYDPTRLGANTSYVRLPFPQHVATQLKIGQQVMLSNFSTPDKTVRGSIHEIRPALDTTTVSREVIVAVKNTRDWRPEGSVRGEAVLGIRKNALVAPEQAVVLRPAGAVVYVVQGDTVQERPVKKGVMRDGQIEIVSGLKAGETVVVDGATLLSQGAKIKVREVRS